MSMPINQQTVLITGAGRGLGAALARAFAREGARVAINYRSSRDTAHRLAAELGENAQAFAADIRDAGAVRHMAADIEKALGPVTTVVHNALADFSFNGDARDPLSALSWEAVSSHMETGVRGFLNLIHATRGGMEDRHFGRIVTIGTNLFQNPVVRRHHRADLKNFHLHVRTRLLEFPQRFGNIR